MVPGSFIYLLADECLPGWSAAQELSSSPSESDGDELPTFSDRFFNTTKGINNDSTQKLYQDDDVQILPDPPSESGDVVVVEKDVIVESSSNLSLHISNSNERQHPLPSNSVPSVINVSGSSCSRSILSPVRNQETALTISQNEDTPLGIDDLISAFSGILSKQQIEAVYYLSGNSYSDSLACLSDPSLFSILDLCALRSDSLPKRRVTMDQDDIWDEMISEYKGNSNIVLRTKLRITLNNQPAVDTGGVRRQVYTTLFRYFASNTFIKLFEGPEDRLRPLCTAEVKSSGLLKILGSIIGHSIYQDGIGFPYLSPVCYWYIACGEDFAVEHATLEDLPHDSASVISQLNEAKSQEDLHNIMGSELGITVLRRCKISELLQMSNKDIIAQHILVYDSTERISKLLDQLCSGLDNLGILQVIRAFPTLFAELFVCSFTVSNEDVIQSLKISPDLEPGDKVQISHLKKFLNECQSENDLKTFLLFGTGCTYARPQSISVKFVESSDAFYACTCSKTLHFPKDGFKDTEYEFFATAFKAAIADRNKRSKSFNTI